MKKMRKLAAFLMVIMLMVSAVGCSGAGGKKDTVGHNGGKDVEIRYWNSGNGTAWLEALINEFNAKQSDWYVSYTATASQEAVLVTFGQEMSDTTDLYFTPGAHDISLMEPLDDILESTAKGDSKSLKEKFRTTYLNLAKAADGHYYKLASGMTSPGIVYNTELFSDIGIEVTPRTTNELAIVCDELLSKGIYPWAHFKNGGYYNRIRTIWQVQYDGYEYYNNQFLSLTDEEGNSPSLDVLKKKDGRYQALKALESVLTPETVLPGSNSYDHVTVQTMFLSEDIGMMVNGVWLSNEMKEVGKVEKFQMMKTPVISSITDKLTTVKSDSLLRKLVSAIDSVTEGKEDIKKYQSGDGYVVGGEQISAADWDYVRAARNTVYTDAISGGAFIPNYSEEKEGAKEFLKFLYSDEGMKIYMKHIPGMMTLDLSTGEEVDTSEWDDLQRSALVLSQSGEQIVTSVERKDANEIFALGLTDDYARYNIIPSLCASNAADRKTADEIWEVIVKRFEASWDVWLETIN